MGLFRLSYTHNQACNMHNSRDKGHNEKGWKEVENTCKKWKDCYPAPSYQTPAEIRDYYQYDYEKSVYS